MRVLLRGSQYNGKARFRHMAVHHRPQPGHRPFAQTDHGVTGRDEHDGLKTGAPLRSRPMALRRSRTSGRGGPGRSGRSADEARSNYREVLVLRFHEELSLEEIARVTRAPLSTVKSGCIAGWLR